MSSSPVGQTIGNYAVLEKLGAGGMGVVYKARDQKLGRTVALKFLPPELDAPQRARNLFLQEARAASALDHPNIGTIHAIEETPDGALFIVMAYYDGETLAQKLRRGPLPAGQAVSIGAQMASGLSEAHAHGIIHRDIKPSNVIVTTQGLAKIVDFGLACVLHSSTATHTGATSGTAAYMSPEQALGKSLDPRTDLWSLGVVLYEMLTDRQPFHAESVPRLLFEIVQSPPAPIEGIAPEVLEIVYRALAKEPSQRYQSAREMHSDLERIDTPAASFTRTLSPEELQEIIEHASRSGFVIEAAPLKKRRWIWGAVAAVILSAAALVTPTIRQRLVPPEKHIAVLPFTAIGSDPSNAAVADGLMESLTSKLSNLEVGSQTLWVVPASEVRRRKIADAAAARREFGATLVVNGTVQRDGSSARLIVNLIDARNMRQVGSGEFQDRGGDFSSLQDSAVTKLANLMSIPLTSEMLRNTGGSVQPAAYESYLKGLGLLQRYDKPGNLGQALAAFDSATTTDPRFALAFSGLGEAYLLKYKTDQDLRWIEQATAACQRAVSLNDQLSPVYVTLGRIHSTTGKNDLALQELQRALELDPRSSEALFALATVYENQARYKEAEDLYRRAAALRQDYWDAQSRLGLFLYRRKRFAEAVAPLKRVVELTPDNATGQQNLGAALVEEGKLPEAASALETAIRIAPSYAAYVNLGVIQYKQKRYAEAARQYLEALKLNDKDYRLWINLAMAERWQNRDEAAVAAYDRARVLLEDLAKTRPQDALVQSVLGLACAHTRHPEEAVSHLETAAALAPADTSVMSRMAEAHEAMGDRRKAIDWAVKAIQHGHSLESMKQNPEDRALLQDPNFKPPIR